MAVALIQNPKSYIGASTDTKPADAPAGSRFYESDTAATYIFDGSNWTAYQGE